MGVSDVSVPSSEPGVATPTEPGITRDRLKDGSLMAAMRAVAPAGVRLRSEAELEHSLEAMLDNRPPAEDLLVFGYGSLMWNPALHYTESLRADLHGWCRRFCITSTMGRGTLQQPGLMLGLDRGGMCRGIAFRIAAVNVRDELRLLWRREMLAGVYQARWVNVLISGAPARALTFIVDRRHERYIGKLSPEQMADLILTGKGNLGTCSAYFHSTLEALGKLGIKDAGMERLRRVLLARHSGQTSGQAGPKQP